MHWDGRERVCLWREEHMPLEGGASGFWPRGGGSTPWNCGKSDPSDQTRKNITFPQLRLPAVKTGQYLFP